jgi:uncharacterized protein YbaP (TraB family)
VAFLLAAVVAAAAGFAYWEREGGERCFLWHLTGKGEIWLMGSLRAVPPDFTPLPHEIEDALHASTSVVVATDLVALDAHYKRTQKRTRERASYPEGDSLSKHLKKETLKTLEEYASGHDIDLAELEPLKPWVTAREIEDDALASTCVRDEGLDRYVLRDAKRRDAKVLELEPFEEQLATLTDLPDELQVALLEDVLREACAECPRAAALRGAWRKGDVATFERLATASRRASPDLDLALAKLLDERNVRWAEKLEGFVRDKSAVFASVDAAHLVGEKGLLELLAGRGFSVEQVRHVPNAEERRSKPTPREPDYVEPSPENPLPIPGTHR